MSGCPKCRGRMTPGFVSVPDYGAQVKWVDGEPKFWQQALGIGLKVSEMSSLRCSQCGFIELYADARSEPVVTLKAVEGETERLNLLVAKLHERLAVLERIATDPAERTAREIEGLRDRPSDDCEGP